MLLSQPRVLLAMARDGMVPPSFFGAVHPRFKTPWKSTILTGVIVAILAGGFGINILTNLCNIGTLLAFVLVSAGVWILRVKRPDLERPFRTPWVPFVPIMGMLCCFGLMLTLPADTWIRLAVWLVIGLVIYFSYGRRHSRLQLERSSR